MTESWYELADRLTAVLKLEAPPNHPLTAPVLAP